MTSQTARLSSGTQAPGSLHLLHAGIDDAQPSSDDIWKRRFRALTEVVPITLYTAAPDNLAHIEYTSSEFTTWLGYTQADWLENPDFFHACLHPEDRERVIANDAAATASGKSFAIEYRLRGADGTWRWVSDSASLLYDDDGSPIAWQGVTVDITVLKAAEARHADARRLHRSLIEQVPAIVFRETVGPSPAPLYVSPQVEALLGYSPDEWLASPDMWAQILYPGDSMRRAMGEGPCDASFQAEYRLLAKDGRIIWVREDRALVRDDQGHPLCWQGLLIDITHQKQLEEELVYQARHDPLTGLPNRAHFTDTVLAALEQGAEDGKQLAIFFVDLDSFKSINDTYGHHVGDHLLVELAKRLRAALRPGDTVARLSGDEFAILLEGYLDETILEAVATRVVAALREPQSVDGYTVAASGSVGVALGRAGTDSLADVMRWADQAMYRAKSLGKDQFVVYSP